MEQQDLKKLDTLSSQETQYPELLTIKKTAEIIGIQYRPLLEAVNVGIVPHYQLGNSRRLVSPTEIITLMKSSQKNTQGKRYE